jgi:HEAT repeat protein
MTATDTHDSLVHAMSSPPRLPGAYRALLGLGMASLPAIRQGLTHPDAVVREHCCKLLDHLLVDDAVQDLIAMVDDADARVRVAALHALSCDRCKTDSCRPDQAVVLPLGIKLLHQDPDARVRAMAAELVGRWTHTNSDAATALARARDDDPSPAVRKKAGWYTPGGPIHRRTSPQSIRRS